MNIFCFLFFLNGCSGDVNPGGIIVVITTRKSPAQPKHGAVTEVTEVTEVTLHCCHNTASFLCKFNS